MLLRTDTRSIMTTSFGKDTTVTSAVVWRPTSAVPGMYHLPEDMEEQCQQAGVVVIAEAKRDGYASGGHYRRAVYDHSLPVAPRCTLHAIMTHLP